jgi:hypothetical protein
MPSYLPGLTMGLENKTGFSGNVTTREQVPVDTEKGAKARRSCRKMLKIG